MVYLKFVYNDQIYYIRKFYYLKLFIYNFLKKLAVSICFDRLDLLYKFVAK